MKTINQTLTILTQDAKFQALTTDLEVLVTQKLIQHSSNGTGSKRTDMPAYLFNAGFTAEQFGELFKKPALNLPDNVYPSHGAQLLMALSIKINARLRALVGIRDLKNHSIEQVTIWMFKQFAQPQMVVNTLQKRA